MNGFQRTGGSTGSFRGSGEVSILERDIGGIRFGRIRFRSTKFQLEGSSQMRMVLTRRISSSKQRQLV